MRPLSSVSKLLIGSLGLIASLLLLLSLPSPAHTQTTIPEDADPQRGQQIYTARCASCHGPNGLGDGPLAAQALNPPTAIGSSDYLANADPSRMFAIISNGNLERGMPGFGEGANSDPLSEAQIWDVIAAVYQLEANATQPIESGRVTGRIFNGTQNAPQSATENLEVILQGFTPNLELQLTLDGAVAEDGSFAFDLFFVPPSNQYRVVATYNDLEFASSLRQLNPADPRLDLPVVVYDTTRDDEVLSIGGMEVVTAFADDQLRVDEVYRFINSGTAVYVGETGDYADGNVRILLPEEAQNVSFRVGFGNIANSFALEENEFEQTGPGEWLIGVPIGPGQDALTLLARYSLPYERGITVAHPLAYPASQQTLVIPENGVQAELGADWEERPLENAIELTGQALQRYVRSTPGTTLEFTLTGFPETQLDSSGNLIENRDPQTELIVGGLGLLLIVAGGLWLANSWRQRPPPPDEREELLARLAALDASYAQKRLRRATYQRERQRLKQRLLALWENEGA